MGRGARLMRVQVPDGTVNAPIRVKACLKCGRLVETTKYRRLCDDCFTANQRVGLLHTVR